MFFAVCLPTSMFNEPEKDPPVLVLRAAVVSMFTLHSPAGARQQGICLNPRDVCLHDMFLKSRYAKRKLKCFEDSELKL